MPQQPDLFSLNADDRSGPAPPAHPAPVNQPLAQQRKPKSTAGQKFGRFLIGAEFLLAIMVRIFIGVIVFILPWSPLWDSNHLLQNYPRLALFFSYGATRGILSGIGLLNLWVAVDDTLHRSQRHI